jgi:hypothetical protein
MAVERGRAAIEIGDTCVEDNGGNPVLVLGSIGSDRSLAIERAAIVLKHRRHRGSPYHCAMPNWVVVSSLATAGGTLVLAGATFASVRSANRSARVAEQSLLAGMRPLLMPSRPEDPPVKVGFADDHYVHVRGNAGTAEATEGAIYMTMSLRNAGSGIAVLHGWRVELTTDLSLLATSNCPDVSAFR